MTTGEKLNLPIFMKATSTSGLQISVGRCNIEMEVFSAIFLAILFVGCQGYSTGPPQDACQDAVPQHVPNVPQDSPCPYLVDSPAFTPGTPHIRKYNYGITINNK